MPKAKDFTEYLEQVQDIARYAPQHTQCVVVIYDAVSNRMRTVSNAPNPDVAREFLQFALDMSFRATVEVERKGKPS